MNEKQKPWLRAILNSCKDAAKDQRDELAGFSPIPQRKLRTLAKRWRKKSKEFRDAARLVRLHGDSERDAARYEGESIAFRWCAEDLEKLLKK